MGTGIPREWEQHKMGMGMFIYRVPVNSSVKWHYTTLSHSEVSALRVRLACISKRKAVSVGLMLELDKRRTTLSSSSVNDLRFLYSNLK